MKEKTKDEIQIVEIKSLVCTKSKINLKMAIFTLSLLLWLVPTL